MTLGALSLTSTNGVKGRRFQAKINGLTTGKIEVLNSGAPGFSVVNGNLMTEALPYDVSTVALREYDPGAATSFRYSRIDITGVTATGVSLAAIAAIGAGRTMKGYRVAAVSRTDGTTDYAVYVEDDLGATVSTPLSGGAPTPTPTPGATAPALTKSSSSGANPMSWSGYYANLSPDSDYIACRWRVNGGAWTSETEHLFTSSDYYDSLDGVATFQWPLFEAHVFATGNLVEAQEGIHRGTDAIVWGNTISDTMAAVPETATTLATSNGNSKSQYVTVSGSPAVAVTGQSGFNNAPISVRGLQSRTGKRQFQATITSVDSTFVWIGLDDGTTNLNSGFPRPGKTNSAGISLSISPFEYDIYVGGTAVQSGNLGTGTIASGDILTVTFDTVAGTASFYRTRSGSTVQIGAAQPVSISPWYPNFGFEGAPTQTALFSTGQARALDTGYVPYDN